MKQLVAALVLVAVACGQTGKSDAPTSSGGSSSGPSAEGGDTSVAVGPKSCLHPQAGLVLPSSTQDKPREAFELSAPFVLSNVWPTWADFAAGYDVNGDAISDFLYLDARATPARFRLALTNAPRDAFNTSNRDCEALQQLPPGRLLLRDLNGDDVPDFIIGTSNGIRAFLNEAEGVRQVLDFTGPYTRGALINVGTADIDADGRVDLVTSWDSPIAETGIDISTATVLFVQGEDGSFVERARRTSAFLAAEGQRPFMPGYFAVGSFDTSASAVLRVYDPAEPRIFAVQTRFGDDDTELYLPAEVDDAIDYFFALPSASGHHLLLAVGRAASYVLELGAREVSVVTSQPLAFPGPHFSHEGGGGPERPLVFAYDVDRDGIWTFWRVTSNVPSSPSTSTSPIESWIRPCSAST
jgi:hypothetical protein